MGWTRVACTWVMCYVLCVRVGIYRQTEAGRREASEGGATSRAVETDEASERERTGRKGRSIGWGPMGSTSGRRMSMRQADNQEKTQMGG